MALRKPQNNSRNNSNSNYEKAAGFININLPTRDGQTLRLSALPLTVESNETHAQLYDYLTVDEKGKALSDAERAKRLENLKSRITLDFGVPRSDEDRALAL